MKTFAISLSLIAFAFACGGKPELDVGEETTQTGEALSDYAADWNGYAEAFKVTGDGSDRVRVTLDGNGQGSLRFGDESLSQPSDPNAYPRNEEPDHINYDASAVVSGIEYPIVNAVVTAARIRFGYDVGARHEAWCALHEPAEVQDSCTGLITNLGTDPETGIQYCRRENAPKEPVTVDCETLRVCSECKCDGTSCHSSHPQVFQVDAALDDDGDSLVGTMIVGGFGSPRVAIRLSR